MTNTIEVSKRPLDVTLHPATVIHSDKYVDPIGWGSRWGRMPYYSRLITEVVFRSKQSGRDWSITIENIELPIYTNQDVTVIAVNNTIVGYIDTQSGKYHYTTSDFAYELDFGVPLYVSILLGLALSTLCFFLLPNDEKNYTIIPITLALLFHIIQRRTWNYRIEKALDRYLQDR